MCVYLSLLAIESIELNYTGSLKWIVLASSCFPTARNQSSVEIHCKVGFALEIAREKYRQYANGQQKKCFFHRLREEKTFL